MVGFVPERFQGLAPLAAKPFIAFDESIPFVPSLRPATTNVALRHALLRPSRSVISVDRRLL